MATPKNVDLVKKTMNLRVGDFEKMKELFPKLDASVAIRDLISAFVDKHYAKTPQPESDQDVEL